MFDSDLGELHRTMGGKLKTRNSFSGNYVPEDVAGIFSSGKRYKMTRPDGEVVYLKKKAFLSDTYKVEGD